MNLTGVSSRPAKTKLAQKRPLQQMDRSTTNGTSNASIATDLATSSLNAGPKEATKKANACLKETTTIQVTIVIKTAITTAITAITGATGTETMITTTIPIMQTWPMQILKLGLLSRRLKTIPLPLPFPLHRPLTVRHSITSLKLRLSSITQEHLDICPLSTSDSSIIAPSPLVPSPLQISESFMQ